MVASSEHVPSLASFVGVSPCKTRVSRNPFGGISGPTVSKCWPMSFSRCLQGIEFFPVGKQCGIRNNCLATSHASTSPPNLLKAFGGICKKGISVGCSHWLPFRDLTDAVSCRLSMWVLCLGVRFCISHFVGIMVKAAEQLSYPEPDVQQGFGSIIVGSSKGGMTHEQLVGDTGTRRLCEQPISLKGCDNSSSPRPIPPFPLSPAFAQCDTLPPHCPPFIFLFRADSGSLCRRTNRISSIVAIFRWLPLLLYQILHVHA